ncbi:MAG: hypothetical protein V1922_03890 [bacterium]
MKAEGPPRMVLSVGGSIIDRQSGTGPITFNTPFLGEFASLLKECSRLPDSAAFVVCGGGLLARAAITLAISQGVTNDDALDRLAIEQTRVNAREVAARLVEADVDAKYVRSRRDMSKCKKNHRVWVTAGDGPGHTTDFVAVKIAEEQQIGVVINLSKTSFLFWPCQDGTPDLSRPIKNMTWQRFFEIFDTLKYSPGLNFPVDPVAAKAAMSAKIDFVCLNGEELGNLKYYLDTGRIRGTHLKAV